MRADSFRKGAKTALDIASSLKDRGKISSSLAWYQTIGGAKVVKDYWASSKDYWASSLDGDNA